MDNNDATAAATSVAATTEATNNQHVALLTDHNDYIPQPQPNSNLTSDNNPSYDAIVRTNFFNANEDGRPLFGDSSKIPTQVRAINYDGGAPVPERHWKWRDGWYWTKDAFNRLIPLWMKRIRSTNPPKWYIVRCLVTEKVVRVCTCFIGADPSNPSSSSLSIL